MTISPVVAMLFIPVSFVAALLIALLAVRLRRELLDTGPLLPILLVLLGGLAILQGVRWGYGIRSLMPLQIALALTLPPLVYLALRRLGESPCAGDLRHAVAPLAGFVAGVIWPPLNDVTIPAIALAYAGLVARLALQGADGLPGTRLSEGPLAVRAVWACAGGLAISGLMDAAVGLDFALGGGRRAGLLATAAQTLGVLLAALAVAAAGRSAPRAEASEPEPAASAPTEDEQALVARLRRLVREHGLHRQPDLTLNRLARRAQVPARQVSQAVNRVCGESVSRFVNRIRVEEACRLLETTGGTVTDVMGASGFQTKSNFNRAFREVTGMGPAEWRQSRRPGNEPHPRLAAGSGARARSATT